jgi:hypothetical protein
MRWLNRTVLGIGLASLFSDWSYEIATTLMPTFLASMGVAAAWLGLIEGVSDGLSSFVKMASSYYTDKLPRRKSVAVLGYVLTALGTAAIGMATAAWHVLLARAAAWLGRGLRTPVRKALGTGDFAHTLLILRATQRLIPAFGTTRASGCWALCSFLVVFYVGIEETLEDSLCAEVVDEAHHGMAFGVLATVTSPPSFASARSSL